MSTNISSASTRAGISSHRVLLIAFGALVLGALLAGSTAVLTQVFLDDSRSRMTLADVVRGDVPGFVASSIPSDDVCGDRRGCVEGIEGDGVAIYRYASLDLARQAVIYSDADLYRSDRLIVEFEETFASDDRFPLIQRVEGTWTGSDD